MLTTKVKVLERLILHRKVCVHTRYPLFEVLFQGILTMKVVVYVGLGSSLCKRNQLMSHNHISFSGWFYCCTFYNIYVAALLILIASLIYWKNKQHKCTIHLDNDLAGVLGIFFETFWILKSMIYAVPSLMKLCIICFLY